MNPYETLGVAREATAEQVRAAFKKLAKRHHPDVAGGENEAFNAICLACDILCDPAARKLYDEWGVIPSDPSSALVLRARQEIAATFAGLLAQATPAQLERIDLIGEVVEGMAGQIAAQRVALAEDLAVKRTVLVLLDDYSFDFEREVQRGVHAKLNPRSMVNFHL